MSDIDPNHPSIRLRVLAKTLERLVRHMHPRLVYMDIAGCSSEVQRARPRGDGHPPVINPKIALKACIDCPALYVGGHRSLRCKSCRKRARARTMARAKLKVYEANGWTPSPEMIEAAR